MLRMQVRNVISLGVLLLVLSWQAVSVSQVRAEGGEGPQTRLIGFGSPDWARPENLPSPPSTALGFPSQATDLDVLPGFQNPPAGYGEVPFWWWTGDPLDKDRLLWQIEELHRQGVAGMQINYAHQDTPGWPTYSAEPEIFSDAWWQIWQWTVGECRKRNMGRDPKRDRSRLGTQLA
jgi:hypothetical protein